MRLVAWHKAWRRPSLILRKERCLSKNWSFDQHYVLLALKYDQDADLNKLCLVQAPIVRPHYKVKRHPDIGEYDYTVARLWLQIFGASMLADMFNERFGVALKQWA